MTSAAAVAAIEAASAEAAPAGAPGCVPPEVGVPFGWVCAEACGILLLRSEEAAELCEAEAFCAVAALSPGRGP